MSELAAGSICSTGNFSCYLCLWHCCHIIIQNWDGKTLLWCLVLFSFFSAVQHMEIAQDIPGCDCAATHCFGRAGTCCSRACIPIPPATCISRHLIQSCISTRCDAMLAWPTCDLTHSLTHTWHLSSPARSLAHHDWLSASEHNEHYEWSNDAWHRHRVHHGSPQRA